MSENHKESKIRINDDEGIGDDPFLNKLYSYSSRESRDLVRKWACFLGVGWAMYTVITIWLSE